MEIDNKRHGKKSDKETQSPVLKVFKEMIKRESNDPEKANLLKEKQENKKRRQYSGSRSKSDREHRSCDSSSSEKNRRNVQYKIAAHEQRLIDYNQRNLNDTPFHDGKKDKWWVVHGDVNKKHSEEDDTHVSCGSCFLKRLITSEYTIMTCLGVLFLVCVLLTFVVLFKTVPVAAKIDSKATYKQPKLFASQALKKKIDAIQRGYSDDRPWDESISRHLSSLTATNGNDFDDGSFRELNTLDESGRSGRELSSFLNAERINEGLSSERLRNFYKKLIQTDAQIRNLKKGVSDYPQNNFDDSKYKYLDRSKRSLRFHLKNHRKKDAFKNNLHDISKHNNIFYPPHTVTNATNRISRKFKRFYNGTDEPTGFLVEKKQILVQYKPQNNLRKVPKCSHAPKDSKSHETDLKHPFYKNTQRLDELLDQLLDKHLPEMMFNPFGMDALFKHSKDNAKNNGKVNTQKTNIENMNKMIKKPMTTAKNKENLSDKIFQSGLNRGSDHRDGPLDKTYFNVLSNRKLSSVIASVTPSYDVLLSVSTIINPGNKVSKLMALPSPTPSLLDRVPNIRRLMQVEEEGEEGIGYEDFKEVLADDTEAHDETEKGQDRKKRMDDDKFEDFKIQSNPYKYNPPGVHNPNWKGPMPLYPDELSSMIQQAAMQNVQKFHQIINIPGNTKEMSSEAGLETGFNDMEYIENYSDNKFENLAKMAQAYSDYGVLYEKKTSGRNEKAMDGKDSDSRVKLSIAKGKSFKNALLRRLKKNKVSEGIRFEIRPTTKSRDDDPSEILKDLENHVRFINVKTIPTSITLNPEYGFCNAMRKQPTKHRPSGVPVSKDEHNEYPIDKVSEGIRFEITPTLKSRDDSPSEILNDLENHVKFLNDKTTPLSLNPEYGVYHSMRSQPANQLLSGASASKDSKEQPKDVMYTFSKNGRRSLKSFEDPDESIEDNDDLNKKESELVVKGIGGPNTQDSNNEAFIVTKMTHGNHFHHQHHHRHHHYNKTNTNNNTNNTEVKLEEKASLNDLKDRNKTDNLTANEASNNNTNNIGNEPNNLISTLLNLNAPENVSHTALSDFFRSMSNWFSVMAGIDTSSEANTHNSSTIKPISSSETMITTPKRNESDIEFPMYDSDMIENIGHRSRVLMSVKENNHKITDANEVSTTEMSERDTEVTSVSSAIIDSHKEDVSTPLTSISTTEIATPTATPPNPENKELTLDKNGEIVDNRTIVKRNIPEDSNLIFWNDIYDDEYGVKMEPLDDVVDEKQDSKGVNFMKKSGNWIQDKVRNFANNIRGKEKMDIYKTNKRRVLRKALFRNDPRNSYIKYKRDTKYDEVNTEEKTDSFAELTAKMKEVCKEAAKAVQQTKNVQVRQDVKEDRMTSSLMQQLVRLMTDLVDFQVQQKTCVKLPPDLQEFLAWLTSPNPDREEFRDQKSTNYNDGNSFDKPSDLVLDLVTTPSSEKETNIDSRSECLGTLHAVQDLMQEYDMMTDEDKSKMTGIRDYLENQLQFLHKQLAVYDGNANMSNMLEDQNPSFRFRRDLRTKYQNSKRKNNKNNRRSKRSRFKRRFLKNFGKKHTRTTASIYDGFDLTEINKFTKDGERKETNENGDKREVNNVKRNLKDVYYKAVYDAKKSTTFKATLKAELEGFEHAQIVRIDD